MIRHKFDPDVWGFFFFVRIMPVGKKPLLEKHTSRHKPQVEQIPFIEPISGNKPLPLNCGGPKSWTRWSPKLWYGGILVWIISDIHRILQYLPTLRVTIVQMLTSLTAELQLRLKSIHVSGAHVYYCNGGYLILTCCHVRVTQQK